MTATEVRKLKAQIAKLIRTAETGEQWAEICRLDAVLNGGPWYAPPQNEHMVDGRRIVTDYWAKPIPIRSCDWSATYGDYDLGRPIGYGATEAEAIADLIENYEP